MVVELYLPRLLFYFLIAFLLGYLFIYETLRANDGNITIEKKKMVFDFIVILRKINLFALVEFVWKKFILAIHFISGGTLSLEKDLLKTLLKK